MLPSPFPEIILSLFLLSVFIITLYTFGEFHLGYILVSKNKKKKYHPVLPSFNIDELPPVTIQLPMYNERYVAEAVIDSCAKLDYPSDKLEIQVIDDSDDETIEIVNKRVSYWKEQGIDIKAIRRTNRKGYKAGALAEATPQSNGEFLAIFDADFRPNPDFLLKSIPCFQNKNVGIVQGRWGHVNREYSWLTRSQTLFLDIFFMVEQRARAINKYFLRFNGSGGIWRKACIDDVGGWSSDTLAEDLDLVFRAQLHDWQVIYDDTLEAPAEVPINLNDFKAQQYRWAKGKAQVIWKLSGQLWRKKMSIAKKFHAYLDLFNIFVIPSVIGIALLSIPIMFILLNTNEYNAYLAWGSFGLLNVFIPPWFCWIVLKRYNKTNASTFGDLLKSIFPFTFLLLGILHTQLASIFDAIFINDKVFHRTSKYNIVGKEGSLKNKVYAPKKISPITYMEGFLILYYGFGLYFGLTNNSFGFFHFHLILVISLTVSVLHTFRRA